MKLSELRHIIREEIEKTQEQGSSSSNYDYEYSSGGLLSFEQVKKAVIDEVKLWLGKTKFDDVGGLEIDKDFQQADDIDGLCNILDEYGFENPEDFIFNVIIE